MSDEKHSLDLSFRRASALRNLLFLAAPNTFRTGVNPHLASDWNKRASRWLRLQIEPANTFSWTLRNSNAPRKLSAPRLKQTIDLALDLVIAEHQKNRLALDANERFVKTGVEITDAYGVLGRIEAGREVLQGRRVSTGRGRRSS